MTFSTVGLLQLLEIHLLALRASKPSNFKQ